MMRSLFAAAALTAVLGVAATAETTPVATPAWSMNATIIEACSCPMFCQCYFSTKPAGHAVTTQHSGHAHHGEEHFCRFNNAFRVNKGSYGAVKLDGAKFWVYGDLGDEFSDGEMEWATITFDKSLTPEQRDAVGKILGALYPVKWKSMSTAEGDITWTASGDAARATLDGGRTAEVALSAESLTRMKKSEPMVLRNLQYWGADANDGFVMMPNTVNAVRAGERQFEFRGTNGFMITVDLKSKAATGKSTGY